LWQFEKEKSAVKTDFFWISWLKTARLLRMSDRLVPPFSSCYTFLKHRRTEIICKYRFKDYLNAMLSISGYAAISGVKCSCCQWLMKRLKAIFTIPLYSIPDFPIYTSVYRYCALIRASVSDWRTFSDMCLIYGWRVTTTWVRRPLWVNQPGQISLLPSVGQGMSSISVARWLKLLVAVSPSSECLYEGKADVVYLQVTLCDPHLSAKWSRYWRQALYKSTFLSFPFN